MGPRPIKFIVTESGCHICVSHKNKVNGYPMITRDGRSPRTLVSYLWEQAFGSIPKGKEICHTCDNPACINLQHVWLGTHKENMMDMASKGRWNPRSTQIGEKNGSSKLTDDLVRYIRKTNFKWGEITRFCSKYGITTSLFHMAKKGKIWKHVS